MVAGTGPLRAALESAGAEVRGWLNHRRLSAVYRSARVLVMPSRWQEPFGIAGLEAWGDVQGLADALREGGNLFRGSRQWIDERPAWVV